MTVFALPVPKTPSVAIKGQVARFAIRRIFCVGRNYSEHAREMGHDPNREPPFFFTKPADAVVDDGTVLPYPPTTDNLHYEGELVVALGVGGANIPSGKAPDHIWGYAAGNDLTRRDLQSQAKELRRPWDMAKGFDNSAICGALYPVSQIGHPEQGRITTCVDGELRQDGNIRDMIWPVADVVAHLSNLVTLAPGDLIYTGTPAGVGPVLRGQSCTVAIQSLGSVTTSFC